MKREQIELAEHPWKGKNGWHSVHKRGEVIVEFHRDFEYDFSIHVVPISNREHPFPERLRDIDGWAAYLWKPGQKCAPYRRICRTPQEAMRDGERGMAQEFRTVREYLQGAL